LTGDVIETLAGEHPDVVLVVTEYLDGDVLAELEKTDEKARADAISCSISHD
jgi:hypothetical protein